MIEEVIGRHPMISDKTRAGIFIERIMFGGVTALFNLGHGRNVSSWAELEVEALFVAHLDIFFGRHLSKHIR